MGRGRIEGKFITASTLAKKKYFQILLKVCSKGKPSEDGMPKLHCEGVWDD